MQDSVLLPLPLFLLPSSSYAEGGTTHVQPIHVRHCCLSFLKSQSWIMLRKQQKWDRPGKAWWCKVHRQLLLLSFAPATPPSQHPGASQATWLVKLLHYLRLSICFHAIALIMEPDQSFISSHLRASSQAFSTVLRSLVVIFCLTLRPSIVLFMLKQYLQ